MTSSSIPPSERRQHERYPVWFPVTVDRGADGVFAICRDASGSGVLVSAVAPLELGSTVRLKFHLEAGQPDREMQAKVVRYAENDDELLLAFPYRIALEFVQRDERFPAELRRRADAMQESR